MKNIDSQKAQGLILKGITGEPVEKVDADRSAAAYRAWESRQRAEPKAGADKLEGAKAEAKAPGLLPHVDQATQLGISVQDHIIEAHNSIMASMEAKTRQEAAGHMMEAARHYTAAAGAAGHAGHANPAASLRHTAKEMHGRIDALYDEKKPNPEYGPLKDLHDNASASLRLLNEEDKKRMDHRVEGKGEGAIPGFRKLRENEASRTTSFSGGPEMRGLREEVRQHLHSLGFGKVGEATKDEGQQFHELWEHPDGRSVRISHIKSDLDDKNIQRLDIKERSKDRFAATRREFVTTYGGDAGLKDGKKPGVAPKGQKVGVESELEFMQPKKD